jgi:hypothetical protein
MGSITSKHKNDAEILDAQSAYVHAMKYHDINTHDNHMKKIYAIIKKRSELGEFGVRLSPIDITSTPENMSYVKTELEEKGFQVNIISGCELDSLKSSVNVKSIYY